MQPNRSNQDNSAIPELDFKPIDERDNDAPGIMPSKTSSMPRAEDDAVTRAKSPEYHDRTAPVTAQTEKGRKGEHSWE